MYNGLQKLWDNKKVIICLATPALFYYLIHSFGLFHRNGWPERFMLVYLVAAWHNGYKVIFEIINIQSQLFVRKVQHTACVCVIEKNIRREAAAEGVKRGIFRGRVFQKYAQWTIPVNPCPVHDDCQNQLTISTFGPGWITFCTIYRFLLSILLPRISNDEGKWELIDRGGDSMKFPSKVADGRSLSSCKSSRKRSAWS